MNVGSKQLEGGLAGGLGGFTGGLGGFTGGVGGSTGGLDAGGVDDAGVAEIVPEETTKELPAELDAVAKALNIFTGAVASYVVIVYVHSDAPPTENDTMSLVAVGIDG